MKIAVTSKSFSKNEILIERIKDTYPNAELALQLKTKGLNQSELIEFLQGCDRAIIALEEINEAVLAKCPELRHISKYGVGLNNIDLKACKKFGVTVGWTGGINKLSVAEMTLGFMLGLTRNLFTSSFELKKGEWNKFGGYQLSEKTVGIIGIGHIGKEVIRLLKPFRCKILVNDILNQEEYYDSVNVHNCSKEEMLKTADIITVHTPLTSDTEGMFNINSLSTCNKKPFLINTARGGIIKEGDLVEAINKGMISGAALDVFVSEPLDIKSLYSHKKIITTPHIGGNAEEAVLAMGYNAIDNLKPYS